MGISVISEPKPSLTLDLTPEEASRIAAAQRQGVDLTVLLRGVIARLPHKSPEGIGGASEPEGLHPGMTFAELLAPMRIDFHASGMTDEELGTFADETVSRVRANRRDLGDNGGDGR